MYNKRSKNPSHGQQSLKTGPCEAPMSSDAFQTSGNSPTPDFSVRDEGSLILLTPLSPSARAFVEEKIGSENGFQPYWPTVVIERRYFSDIAEGILADGLVLQ